MPIGVEHYIGGWQAHFDSPHNHHHIHAYVEYLADGYICAGCSIDGISVYYNTDHHFIDVSPEGLASIIEHVTGINVEVYVF